MASPELLPRSGRPGRPGRPRGPRRDRAERRAELLDAAERAIRRTGPKASMDEIAAEAGITKPILYTHFGDKAGLVRALAGRVAEQVNREVTSALARSGEPREVLSSTLAAFCAFIEREPELYRFLLQTARHATDRSGPRLVSDLGSRIAVTLGAGLRRAGADSGAAELWAYSIVGTAFAGAGWWLEHRTLSRDDVVDHLTELLWSGLSGVGLGRLQRDEGDADRAHLAVVPDPPAAGDG
jgi:AcrR family transcriptional regulator